MSQQDFRVEKDFLGEKKVPKEVYYGIQTLRALENFPITGYRIDSTFIKALAIVKKAAALANMETGHLSPRLGQIIVQVTDEILAGHLHDQFLVDPIQGGAGTSINMNINEVIANRGLELLGKEKGDYFHLSPNTHVNMSQSTNDVVPTAAHIAILTLIDELLQVMKEVRLTLRKKAEEFDHIIKVGRTHLQDAVPIRLGQEFKAYERVLDRDILRIEQCKPYLYEVNMGATAVGTGLNADPAYIQRVVKHLAEISGYPIKNAEDLVDSTQNTDEYTMVSAALKICMINMSKIANDIRLMASGPRAGFNELSLPPRQPGSSIMPGKVNPVMAEVINQIAFQVIGNDYTICLASEAGQLELNVMLPVLLFNLMQSLKIMKNGFEVFHRYCLVDIKANQEKMKSYVEQSLGVLTAISPHIGYDTVSRIAFEAIRNGKTVRELCRLYNILDEEELDLILDPYNMTKPGIVKLQPDIEKKRR